MANEAVFVVGRMRPLANRQTMKHTTTQRRLSCIYSDRDCRFHHAAEASHDLATSRKMLTDLL